MQNTISDENSFLQNTVSVENSFPKNTVSAEHSSLQNTVPCRTQFPAQHSHSNCGTLTSAGTPPIRHRYVSSFKKSKYKRLQSKYQTQNRSHAHSLTPSTVGNATNHSSPLTAKCFHWNTETLGGTVETNYCISLSGWPAESLRTLLQAM
jgi:hypothetical protein